MKNLTLIIAFLFIGIYSVSAQEATKPATVQTLPEGYKTITGVVTDNMGMPIPSVNVKIQGTKDVPVQTNFDGEFSIVAKEGSRLEISFVSMKTQVITVSKLYTYNITLQDNMIDTGLVIYDRGSEPIRGVAAYYMFGYR